MRSVCFGQFALDFAQFVDTHLQLNEVLQGLAHILEQSEQVFDLPPPELILDDLPLDGAHVGNPHDVVQQVVEDAEELDECLQVPRHLLLEHSLHAVVLVQHLDQLRVHVQGLHELEHLPATRYVLLHLFGHCHCWTPTGRHCSPQAGPLAHALDVQVDDVLHQREQFVSAFGGEHDVRKQAELVNELLPQD